MALDVLVLDLHFLKRRRAVFSFRHEVQLEEVGDDVEAPVASRRQAAADFLLPHETAPGGDFPLVAESAAGVLRGQQPIRYGLHRIGRNVEAGLLRFPGTEHPVLGHRGVARLLLVIPPAAVLLLPGVEEFQQAFDFRPVFLRIGVTRKMIERPTS